jgi:hypothetical protein
MLSSAAEDQEWEVERHIGTQACQPRQCIHGWLNNTAKGQPRAESELKKLAVLAPDGRTLLRNVPQ